MVFNEHVKIRREKFGAVIFETLREKVFVTNETGKDIIFLLQQGKSPENILKVLVDSCNASETDIEEDVNRFIGQLKDNYLVKE